MFLKTFAIPNEGPFKALTAANGTKDSKTTKNGNFEVPQTSSKQNRAQNNDDAKITSEAEELPQSW